MNNRSASSLWLKQKEEAVKVSVLRRKENFISSMLFDLLSCVAPHPSYDTIVAAIKKYLPKDQKMWTDGAGNLIVKVGQKYTTMFSCHIDMVFGKRYMEDAKCLPKGLDLFIATDQEHAKANFVWGGIITKYEKGVHTYTPTTLGADDKAGIFILLSLIRAKIPGLYIFHAGEELGGVGSADIVKRSPTIVKGIERAIAFDRMDYFDIINRQRGGVCCSLTFAKAFANQLNDLIITPNKINTKYSNAIGSFTDTANYTKLISECTNLSVGYFNQHSSSECLDTLWLEKVLTPALLQIDWEKLPTERSLRPVQNLYKTAPSSPWPQTKYTTYADINFSTLDARLPPWDLKKGIIKSCSETGMRRLIKKYIADGATNMYLVQQGILELLQENIRLKEKDNVIHLPNTSVNAETKQKEILYTLAALARENFKIYKDNYSRYTENIAEYGETLEWVWTEAYRFDLETTKATLPKMCELMKKIVSEIIVINTTLLTNINVIEILDADVYNGVIKGVEFFKENWAMLGYNSKVEVQDDFKQIRDKITTTN